MMDDKALRLEIIDELDFEPSIRSENIGVSVSSGVVTLTGHVESYAEKLAAERAVTRLKGVKALAMELDVKLPSAYLTSDDEIAKRAVGVLKWSVGTPDAVKIKVENGWITLSGSVDWAYQKQSAEKAVNKLTGVRGISNLIAIKATVSPSNVREKIEKAFLRNAELEADRITVKASDGTITLEGAVKTWHERQIAEQAAWSAPGVTTVEDHIRVS
jgi:osmotically-inducible protein OsmY